MRGLEEEIHKLRKKLMYLEIAVLGASFFWASNVWNIQKEYNAVMDYYQQIQTQVLELNQNLRDLSQELEFYFDNQNRFRDFQNQYHQC